MFSSLTLSLVFTVTFLITGGYSLIRLAELTTAAETGGSRVAELSHLLMSIAMIAMTWAASGGPSSASGLVQVVVFGVFGVWFLARLAIPTAGHSRVVAAYHVIMNAAMMWMVAAMPQIMGMAASPVGGSAGAHPDSTSTPGMAGMPGMTGMPGMAGSGGMGSSSMSSGAPGPVAAVSGLFLVLLAGAAVLWAVRIARPSAGPACGPTGAGAPVGDSVGDAGAVAVATRPARPLTGGPRFDAGCHLLMSLGMAGMLLVML